MNRLIMMVVLLLGSLAALILSGCYYDKEELLYHNSVNIDCSTVTAKFSTDVNPVILNKCSYAGCHDAATRAGNAVLLNYTQISSYAAQINQRCVIDKNMPPGSPLTATELAAIKCWIDSGAPNN